MDVATIFVSPVVKSLITKVLSYSTKEIALVWGVKGQLEKLARTLERIDAVLLDAEKRQLVNDRLVNLWLGELEDVAHDAEDILDELQYESLRRQMKNEGNILRLLPSKPFEFGYKNKIAHKIRGVNTKLDEITKGMEKFKFINQRGGSGSNIVMNEARPETSSHINDLAAVVGRKYDTSTILGILNDCSQESYSVVRITGMGGIGKTTLAQLVYANTTDENKMWVSMYGKSDNKEIFGDLLKSGAEGHSSLNVMKDRLKMRLEKGKSLIVLDDVWMNHGIDVKELLKDLLSLSCKGSKILMTMRSAEDIAPMTDCRYTIHRLHALPEDVCWSIIRKIAFGHGGLKETANLSSIGRQIASKCGGLPLAAKTIGGLLYSRNDEEEWLSVLNSPIWNLLPTDDKIISILKLSYDHLSPYVKQCFTYCSIFPKGHKFLKKELVRMWMAEGFLNSPWQPNASPETVGNEYFKILLFSSFFQDESKNKWGNVRSCRMHDLVHDLAISVAGSGSRMVKLTTDYDPDVIQQSYKCRRLGLQVLDRNVTEIPSKIYRASQKLHTFVSFGSKYGENVWVKQIFNLSLLRVLNLSHTGIEELPQSICKLKHLRYLDLSYTKIHTFPSSFSQLYNLQTLILNNCQRLNKFPTNMRNLINLEYFIFNERLNMFTQMPRELRRLGKLKKLSAFTVGEGEGYGIEELKDLNLLGGKLIIRNLGRVRDAKQANLMRKKNITHLQLRWWSKRNINNNDNVVINDLQPHTNLKELTMSCFGGSKFPTWMMSTSVYLPNLVYVTIQDCSKCEHLPALGRLQSLRYLRIERMGGIKQIGNEFYQSNEEASCTAESSFPSLLELHLGGLYNLEEWLEDQRSSTSSFASLEKLDIFGCPKLFRTPTRFPSLTKLKFGIEIVNDRNIKCLPLKLLRRSSNLLQTIVVWDCDAFEGFIRADENQRHYQSDLPNNLLSKIDIWRCPSLTVLPADFRGLNSLTYLSIKDCRSLQSLPNGIQYLPVLRKLVLGGFSEDLESFPFPAAARIDDEHYFVSLRELTIMGWPTLAVLPDQLQLLTSLQHLNIKYFSCLLSLPEWFGELSSLHTLNIEKCKELKYLPSVEQMQRLTSLQKLYICNSPVLYERCCPGNEEAHKIAHFNLKQARHFDQSWEREI